MDRMALLLTLLYFVSTIWIFSYILSFLGLPKNEPKAKLDPPNGDHSINA
jgi:hypothetical protein